MTMLFDAPKAPMTIISNPLRSTKKSARPAIVSYAKGGDAGQAIHAAADYQAMINRLFLR
jgi:hypothetical protein